MEGGGWGYLSGHGSGPDGLGPPARGEGYISRREGGLHRSPSPQRRLGRGCSEPEVLEDSVMVEQKLLPQKVHEFRSSDPVSLFKVRFIRSFLLHADIHPLFPFSHTDQIFALLGPRSVYFLECVFSGGSTEPSQTSQCLA